MADTIVVDALDRLAAIFTDALSYNSAQEASDPSTVNTPFVNIWAQDASHTSDYGEGIVLSQRQYVIRCCFDTLDRGEPAEVERQAYENMQDAITALNERQTLWVTDRMQPLDRIERVVVVEDSGFLPIVISGKTFAGFLITVNLWYITGVNFGV